MTRGFPGVAMRYSATFSGALRGASRGPADGPDLVARSAAAEEQIVAVGLEPRHAHAPRHLEGLEHLVGAGIDSPHLALVAFPGPVPELSVDPGDAGGEAVGLDRAKDRAGPVIDLMDHPGAVLTDPQRPFAPREPGVTAVAGRRDRGDHVAGLWIDLVNAPFGDLI